MNNTNKQISKPEYDPHATNNQPIELEAPVAGREGGQSELWKYENWIENMKIWYWILKIWKYERKETGAAKKIYQKLFHCIIRNLSIIRKSRSTDGNIVFVFVFLFEIQNKLLGLLWNTKDYQKVYCNSDTSTWHHKRSFQVYMTLQCSTRKMVLIGKS